MIKVIQRKKWNANDDHALLHWLINKICWLQCSHETQNFIKILKYSYINIISIKKAQKIQSNN